MVGASYEWHRRAPAHPCRNIAVVIYFHPPRSPLKSLHFVAASRDELRELPDEVQHAFGFSLFRVQVGDWPPEARSFGEGLPRSIAKLSLNFGGESYRLAFTIALPGAVYVLHAFQKKSRSGVKTPRRHIERIQVRLAQAKAHHRGHQASP